jgi:hypothetical protein
MVTRPMGLALLGVLAAWPAAAGTIFRRAKH